MSTCQISDSASGFEAFSNSNNNKNLMHFNCMEQLPFRNYAVGMAIQSVHCSFSCISPMANGFCKKGPIDFFLKCCFRV